MTGTHVTFDTICSELRASYPTEQIAIVDTSQKLVKRHVRIASLANLKQAARILAEYRHKLLSADRVLVFGSNGFLCSLAPVLVWLARRRRVPIHLRAFGGSLDNVLAGRNPLKRVLLRRALAGADSISVQTTLLRERLASQFRGRVDQTPGFRRSPAATVARSDSKHGCDRSLRLIYVGLLRVDKGVVVLLTALRQLAAEGRQIECHLYGHLWPQSAAEINRELERTPAASYKGVIDPEQVINTMSQYDALVFPSYYAGEGHPGVVIESMMAGIAVVTTFHRSIPELVQHETNGLLAGPQDPASLADAIRRLDDDRELLRQLAQRNWERRTRFLASENVPRLLAQMGVTLAAAQ